METGKSLKILLVASVAQIAGALFFLIIGGLTATQSASSNIILLAGIHSLFGIIIGISAVWNKNRCLLITVLVNSCIDIFLKTSLACRLIFVMNGSAFTWGLFTSCVIAIICDFVAYYSAYSAVKKIKKQMNQQQFAPQGYGTPSAGPGYPNPGSTSSGAPGQPGPNDGHAPTSPE
ncbi:hypothetical protein PFISCL1PPCAC_4349 [Pristionchus fissidentatus]|uniref:MARVEL domain-containing protein n=1 Tax=Pristionchus fissidentatus TaxID=1538716 RepID=A0AAV5V2L6_9BILA|nr:hypothetical protein PFISCL1PPCAC_4349 [Pristionchus fissidentatus]